MNLKALRELHEFVAHWSDEHKLTPEEEIEILQQQLAITTEGLRIAMQIIDTEKMRQAMTSDEVIDEMEKILLRRKKLVLSNFHEAAAGSHVESYKSGEDDGLSFALAKLRELRERGGK